MSGLEPFAALGLACSVFQVLSFAKEVCMVGRAICEKGEPADSEASLANSMSNLSAITKGIERSVASKSSSLSPNDTRMLQIAQDCNKAALELKAELDKHSGAASSAQGSRLRSIWVAAGSVARSRGRLIDRLEKRLQTHQNTLETQLLVNICSKADAAKLCQKDEFKNLDTTLRDFVKRYSEGETRIMAAINDLDGAMKVSNRWIVTEKKRKKLIGSLKYSTMNDRRNQIVDPHTKTFEWIFTGQPVRELNLWEDNHLMTEASARFSVWLRDPAQPLFWITGKPGSGKSTLVKFLAEDPRTRTALSSSESGSPDVVILSHFIWSAGQAMESSVKGMLCSLIYQLLKGDESMADELFRRSLETGTKDSCSDWSEKELRSVLRLLLSDSSKTFYLFIDGLDEISNTDGQLKLIELLKKMRASSNVKMCVSSRPEPMLKKHLAGFPTFRMQDLTQADIFEFTSSLLKRRLLDNSIDLSETDYETLVRKICRMAEGVFLWVALVVRNVLVGIEKGDEMKQLERRLEMMPSELRDLYRAMWNRVGTEKEIYQWDAAVYFNLVILSSKDDPDDETLRGWPEECTPLLLLFETDDNLADRALLTSSQPRPSVHELQTLANKLARQVEVRCLGLLDVKTWDAHPKQMNIAFVHRSAREFLETDAEGRALLELDTSAKQERRFRILKANLAQSFLAHLGNIGVTCFYERFTAEDFLWNTTRLCDKNLISQSQLLQLCLWSRPLFGPYHQLCEGVSAGRDRFDSPDLLGAAAEIGYLSLLQHAISTRPCWGVNTGKFSVPYMSYLVTMALRDTGQYMNTKKDRRIRTVRWLLTHDINPNFPIWQCLDAYLHHRSWSIPTTPLKEVLIRLLNLDLFHSTLVDVLTAFVKTGGDLSSPLILVLEETRMSPPDEMKLRLNILNERNRQVGLFIEVEIALVIRLLVRKFVKHAVAADAASVKKLHTMLESSPPTAELSVKRVAVSHRFSPVRLERVTDEEDLVSYSVTDDTACLSRVQEHLKGGLEEDYAPAPQKNIAIEVSTSWLLYDMVKEVEETGKLTTWGDICADWVSKGILWHKNDPRQPIPDAWKPS